MVTGTKNSLTLRQERAMAKKELNKYVYSIDQKDYNIILGTALGSLACVGKKKFAKPVVGGAMYIAEYATGKNKYENLIISVGPREELKPPHFEKIHTDSVSHIRSSSKGSYVIVLEGYEGTVMHEELSKRKQFKKNKHLYRGKSILVAVPIVMEHLLDSVKEVAPNITWI